MKKAGNVAWTWCTSLPLALGKTCMQFAITDSRSKGGVCLLCRWSSPPTSFITGWFDWFLITCSNMEQIWKKVFGKTFHRTAPCVIQCVNRICSGNLWEGSSVEECGWYGVSHWHPSVKNFCSCVDVKFGCYRRWNISAVVLLQWIDWYALASSMRHGRQWQAGLV